MSIAVTPMLLFMRAAPNPAQKAQPRSHKD